MNTRSKFRKNTGRKNEDEENWLDKKRKYKDLNQRMWIKVDPNQQFLCFHDFK